MRPVEASLPLATRISKTPAVARASSPRLACRCPENGVICRVTRGCVREVVVRSDLLTRANASATKRARRCSEGFEPPTFGSVVRNP